MRSFWVSFALVLLAVVATAAWVSRPGSSGNNGGAGPTTRHTIRGSVRDSMGPVAGAEVRKVGDSTVAVTDGRGRFQLAATEPNATLAAWKDGYYIATTTTNAKSATMTLERLPESSTQPRAWIDPRPQSEAHSCSNCHEQIYEQWQTSGHSRGVDNHRFMNLYTGEDREGNPNRGWNLLADYPNGAGVCRACHAPSLDLDGLGVDNLTQTQGVHRLGSHCDFCHKVRDARDVEWGLTHGRDAFDLVRPANDLLFFGPMPDAVGEGNTFSKVFQQSRYCAACHEGVVFGAHVYGTYSEYLESPAARAGMTCQNCHMANEQKITNIAPGHGGASRKMDTLSNHQMLPGGRLAMLRKSVRVTATLRPQESSPLAASQLVVQLEATNVGHRVPTGFIDRHLILSVEPQFAGGASREIQGPRIPAAADKALGGKPGALFGRLLSDDRGDGPVPFWRPHREEDDTRLTPGDPPRRLRFAFSSNVRTCRVRLLYRRFWSAVAREKGWTDDTLVVFDKVINARESK